MNMKLALAAFAACSMLVATTTAQAFSFSVDRYEVNDGTFPIDVDEFGGASLSPSWASQAGTVGVSGDHLNLSAPGAPSLAVVPGWDWQQSNVGQRFVDWSLSSSPVTNVESTWAPISGLAVGENIALTISTFASATTVRLLSVTLANRHPVIAADTGAAAGLTVSFLEALFDTTTGAMTFGSIIDQAIPLPSLDGVSPVRLGISFNENTLVADAYWNIGGVSGSSASSLFFNPLETNGFVSGQLSAGTIVPVPEPGTALLMGLGLAGLASIRGREAAAA